MTTKLWARMDGDVAAELITLDAALTPGKDIYHSSMVFLDVTAVTGIKVGWLLTGSPPSWAAPSAPVYELAGMGKLLNASASYVCTNITGQVAGDQTHLNAYLLASALVGPTATPPTADPAKSAFNALAQANNAQPQAFATLVNEVAAVAMSLSSALTLLAVATASAQNGSDLNAALTAFSAAIASVLASIKASGLTVTPPAPITILGINA